MDDLTACERAGHEGAGHSLQGPHRDFGPPLPTDFVPLRLHLQPDGACIEVTQANALIGRHSAADIRLASGDVSRRHCLLLFDDGHWNILDLGSLNGVFVNDERMHEATLYDGDRLRLGRITFAVELKQPSAEAQLLRPIKRRAS